MKLPESLTTVKASSRKIFIEGWLYWYTAFGVTAQEFLSSEEAYKYINPALLFWIRAFLGSSVAGFNAVKAFRSMTYGRLGGGKTELDNSQVATRESVTEVSSSSSAQTQIAVSVQQPKTK